MHRYERSRTLASCTHSTEEKFDHRETNLFRDELSYRVLDTEFVRYGDQSDAKNDLQGRYAQTH